METIEALRPLKEEDDRVAFDCGRPALNGWFQRHAWRNQKTGASRTSVLADPTTGAIAGYVALTVGDIRRSILPKPRQRNMPDPIPVALLGQLAVDMRYQGRGVSKLLLAHAFTSTVHLSKIAGVVALATHPLDDDVREYYRRRGFADLDADPQRAMYIRVRDLEKFGVA